MYRRSRTRAIQHLGLFITILFSVFFIHTFTTHAQSSLTGNPGVEIISKPQFPGANSTVEVSLDDYSLNTAGASIAWYVNNTELTKFRNARSATLQTGALGERVTVRVALTRNNLPPLTATLNIIPTKVDMILESSTYVPSFYKGRALPSSESLVRAIAIVHDGTETPDTTYTYTWSLDETVLLGGPVKGKNVLNFTMPHFDDKRLIVEVFATDGTIVGRQSLTLNASRPELHFYEQSPLRGLFQKEVTDPFTLIGNETTIYGEPYFINTNSNDGALEFTWNIDGERVASDTTAPNAITLRHVGGGGNAEVSLKVIKNERIPQFVKKTFQIFFK